MDERRCRQNAEYKLRRKTEGEDVVEQKKCHQMSGYVEALLGDTQPDRIVAMGYRMSTAIIRAELLAVDTIIDCKCDEDRLAHSIQ